MPLVHRYIQEIGKLLNNLLDHKQSQSHIEDQLTVIKRVFRSQIKDDPKLAPKDRHELYKILEFQSNFLLNAPPDLSKDHLPNGTIIYAKKDQSIWTKRNNLQDLGVWDSEGRTMNVQDLDVREKHYFEILYIP